MSITGRIHSFESFGTVDGPGIRFVVFLQGCPLRCVYCHNRDTWDAHNGTLYTTDQVLSEAKKYINYMKFSNGGITLSGGEPTLQAHFAAELFKKCKEEGIHTALDTSGYTDIDKLGSLLDYTDLILLDIKHSDNEIHKKITGVNIDKIHKFARHAAQINIPIWIRYVLIPGLTDSQDNLEASAELIRSLGNVEKIEILPYHNMGIWKWEKLGDTYTLGEIQPPSTESLKKAYKILNS